MSAAIEQVTLPNGRQARTAWAAVYVSADGNPYLGALRFKSLDCAQRGVELFASGFVQKFILVTETDDILNTRKQSNEWRVLEIHETHHVPHPLPAPPQYLAALADELASEG